MARDISKLLPCPFCGNDVSTQDPLDTVYPCDRQMTLFQTVCNSCSATVLGETGDEAVANWNRRVKI